MSVRVGSACARVCLSTPLAPLVIAVMLAGCRLAVVRPNDVVVTAKSEGEVGLRVPNELPVILTVNNRSEGLLRFKIADKRGPPFGLSWLYYRVFRQMDGRWVRDDALVPFEDGVVPLATLRIDEGDTAALRIYLEGVRATDCASMFRVDLEDEDGGVFRSEPFRPCVAQ